MPACRLSLDTDRLKAEAVKRLKIENEGEGRRKVVVSDARRSPPGVCPSAWVPVCPPGLPFHPSSPPARPPALPQGPRTSSHLPAPAPMPSVLQAASDRKKEGSSALDEFCRDLTAEAAQQRTDPVRKDACACSGAQAVRRKPLAA